ncbi:stomatal closure-related actin-binding protein 1-like [Silene latifolia]|uniref:stomatal closure-related actin-binding protein 1-like n=1 Tax=Silene latifolia TaxID=37657 RepID=UPI003D77ECE7
MDFELRALRVQLMEKSMRSAHLQKELTVYIFVLILGATKPVYAPEPFDVGRFLIAEIVHDGPIDPAPGLGSYVEALVRRHDTEFNVVVTQMNGVDQQSQTIHVLHVGKMRMKLCKGTTVVAKEYYSSTMQLCWF